MAGEGEIYADEICEIKVDCADCSYFDGGLVFV